MINRVRAWFARAARRPSTHLRAREATGSGTATVLPRGDVDEVVLLAHDIRNLLIAADKSVAAIREREDTGVVAVAGGLRDFDAASERAHRLAHRLMSVDRLSRRVWRPIDVNIVVIECGRLMQRIVGDGIRVTLELGVNSDCIMAERIELERILLTVAMSARRAMPHGGVLTVQTTSLTAMPPQLQAPNTRATPCVRLTFTDSGAGLLSPGRSAVVRDKPLRGLHGADLAMAVIAHTVRTLDGTLQILDAERRGSRVIIDLPSIDPMGRPELIETM